MYLAADGPRLVLSAPHLIQAQDLARRVVELVVVDLDVRKGSVELHIDVALPRSEAQVRHGGVWRDVCERVSSSDDAGYLGSNTETRGCLQRKEGR